MTEPTRPQPSAEPVAYLYESEFGDKDLLLSCDGELARRLIELGRTEAPLYPASALEAARREALEQAHTCCDCGKSFGGEGQGAWICNPCAGAD